MASSKKTIKPTVEPTNDKRVQLESFTDDAQGKPMRTNTGTPINDDQNTLKAGERGPSLLEDFIYREKMTHFDHERIPERVVHARGSGAHGVFKLYNSMEQYTKAQFLNDTEIETPVFVRFSTVAGSKGSTDLARDVRGFAVRFYTQQGNFDLVGNNMPVFFIQDAIKFPDLVHAVKPEPDNEIPQAASAHDTFWDFISLTPESAHMIMWVMSDRALPRSYRMMEGFGVHTFRLVNAEGVACFVKFHWKPLLGVHSVAWDEAQNISGKDPDFHRRDLWDAIDSGAFPEWELGVQIIPEEDEFKYDFDLLDATKLVPEELVPVQRIGKLTLNRNPDNFFAETEQVAFHLGHIVPGIDFTNDPLLQGRLFSYTDTQLLRLGGPNFQQLPINKPVIPVYNNQRDGFSRQNIDSGKTSYSPNTLGNDSPHQVKAADGGYVSYTEKVEGRKVRARSESFRDHFSQARLFFNSQSDPEKEHLVQALCFELGKVKTIAIRERMLGILSLIDKGLAGQVAVKLGLHVPQPPEQPVNHIFGADTDPETVQPVQVEGSLKISPALSIVNTVMDSIQTRKVAILAADGVDEASVKAVKEAVEANGGVTEIVSTRLGFISSLNGEQIQVDDTTLTTASVLFDAVYVPGGTNSVAEIEADANSVHFLNEAFKHCKPIAADAVAMQVIEATYFSKKAENDEGVIIGDDANALADQFVAAIKLHRFWEREKARLIPA
ncbi:catalase [Mucilaginibacter daejeonensis]|uniref:catalase n=1 Tax=Mucilaginibacter daejeonensis TaxID=398049 RepID=UPI001D17724C|nr:catalase [Mucilaginibacter daejeonensis]UEG54151.1 catalase [Mucilaginibacter daejeonensis]